MARGCVVFLSFPIVAAAESLPFMTTHVTRCSTKLITHVLWEGVW